MASLGGSLLGSMLGNAISGPRGGTTVVNSGSPGVAAGSAPVLVEGTGGSSVWSFLGDLIGVITILAILAAAVFIVLGLWRLRQSKKLADAGLPFGAIEKFMAVQKAYAGKDSEALGALLGPDMKQMLDDLPETAAVSQIRNVSYEVLDMSRGAISIWYKADDFADDSKISETWHFTQQGSGWVLNGIEQV